jgi:hypothetical protein
MGQKHVKIQEEKLFLSLPPEKIAEQIVNSSDYYLRLVKIQDIIWRSSKIERYKNYEYSIVGNINDTKITLYNCSPYLFLKTKTNDEKCYICLSESNIDCKMKCCNYYLHYDCAKKLDSTNKCSICKKENLVTIRAVKCQCCKELFYTQMDKINICEECE